MLGLRRQRARRVATTTPPRPARRARTIRLVPEPKRPGAGAQVCHDNCSNLLLHKAQHSAFLQSLCSNKNYVNDVMIKNVASQLRSSRRSVSPARARGGARGGADIRC